MPRGFERNIIWGSDPEKQPHYVPFADAFRNVYASAPLFSDYDLGFLASCRIKA